MRGFGEGYWCPLSLPSMHEIVHDHCSVVPQAVREQEHLQRRSGENRAHIVQRRNLESVYVIIIEQLRGNEIL